MNCQLSGKSVCSNAPLIQECGHAFPPTVLEACMGGSFAGVAELLTGFQSLAFSSGRTLGGSITAVREEQVPAAPAYQGRDLRLVSRLGSMDVREAVFSRRACQVL